jgi:acetyl esterase/lipase
MSKQPTRPRNLTSALRILTLAASMPWALPARSQDASTYFTVKNAQMFKTDWTGFYRTVDAATAALRSEIPHLLDVAYGQDLKQRLDLYMPVKKCVDAPVFLFLHGGGFREGDRAQYGFVAKPFVQNGIIVAVASYRLTDPGFAYPSQTEDVRRAIQWLHRNIQNHGGDGMKLFVGGHSAGGVLAADVGVNRGWMGPAEIPKQAFRGMLPISALYDLRVSDPLAADKVFWSTYAASDQQRYAASPILHISDPVPQALVAVGSTERQAFEDFVAGSMEFVQQLNAAGVDTKFINMEGGAHRDTALALGDSASELAQAAVTMILSA